MARVKFIRDEEPNILALSSNKKVIDGALYVATDTGSMWLGVAENRLLQINAANLDKDTTYTIYKSGNTIFFQDSNGTVTKITDDNTIYDDATDTTAGLMSAADKKKLDSIQEGANKYVLPAASSTTLGGVKVGKNLTIAEDGTLAATVELEKEVSDRKAADTALGKRVDAEATAREEADTALGSRIDNAEAEISNLQAEDWYEFTSTTDPSAQKERYEQMLAHWPKCYMVSVITVDQGAQINAILWPYRRNDSQLYLRAVASTTHNNVPGYLWAEAKVGPNEDGNVQVNYRLSFIPKTTWETLVKKPFSTIGSGLKVVNNALTVDTEAASHSHTHDDRYYTESEIDSKLAAETKARTDADTALDTAYKAADAAIGARIDNAETEISANSADLTGIKGLTYGTHHINFIENSNGEYTSPALDEIAEQIAQDMACIQIQADATTMDADTLNKLTAAWPRVILLMTKDDTVEGNTVTKFMYPADYLAHGIYIFEDTAVQLNGEVQMVVVSTTGDIVKQSQYMTLVRADTTWDEIEPR